MIHPFVHDELEAKKILLDLARKYRKEMGNSVEKELAAGMIYMNLADYLAEYMVVGFNTMAKEAMNKYYLGVIGINPPQNEELNIGSSMKRLERFEFANKGEILRELMAINKARITFAHKLFKTSSKDAVQIDQSVRDIIDHTEKLVVLVDDLSPGLPPRTINDRLIQNPSAVQEDAQAEVDSKKEASKKAKS